MADITIDRLEIRLKGVPSQVARTMIAGMGDELLEKLTNQESLLNEKRIIKISKIESGTFKAGKDISSSELRSAITGRIVESIVPKIYNQEK